MHTNHDQLYLSSLLTKTDHGIDSSHVSHRLSPVNYEQYKDFHLLASPIENLLGFNNQHVNVFNYVHADYLHTQSMVGQCQQYSLHCDASMYGVNDFETLISPNLPNSIIAGIIKHNNEDFFLFKKPIICRDNNMAELYAINEGLQIAASLNITQLNIYTDSSVSITFIRKHVEQHAKYMKNEKFIPLTQQIISSLQSFQSCNFYHVPRKMNKQADKITKHTKSLYK